MSGAVKLKRASVIAMVLALGVVIGLVAWRGVDALAEVISVAGWRILWLVPLFIAPLLAATWSWRLLFAPGAGVPRWTASLYGNAVGMAANWLLPVAQVGGELIKARLMHRRGTDGADAIASVAVDKTVQTFSQAAYTLIGLALFAATYANREVIFGSVVVTVLMAIAVWSFYRAQQRGLFRWLVGALQGMLPKGAEGLEASAEQVDQAVRATYDRGRRLGVSSALSLVHRLLFAFEVWLVLWLLGHPVGVVEALILESLGQAVRAAAFLVPGGLGAQEGGFVLLGVAIGLSPDVSLSLALCKRVRELAVGLPALALWQLEEARGVFAAEEAGRR